MSKKKGDWMKPEQRAAFNRMVSLKAKASGKARRWSSEQAKAAALKSAEARKKRKAENNRLKNEAAAMPRPPEVPAPMDLDDLP